MRKTATACSPLQTLVVCYQGHAARKDSLTNDSGTPRAKGTPLRRRAVHRRKVVQTPAKGSALGRMAASARRCGDLVLPAPSPRNVTNDLFRLMHTTSSYVPALM